MIVTASRFNPRRLYRLGMMFSNTRELCKGIQRVRIIVVVGQYNIIQGGVSYINQRAPCLGPWTFNFLGV